MGASRDDQLERPRYELRGQLGAGGMGVVHRAYDRVRRTEVALKTLLRVDGAALYRFKNEFRALAGIVHPNLVTLYELHADDDRWYFSMELVDGVSFLEHVRPYQHLIPDDDTRDLGGARPDGVTGAGSGPDAPSVDALTATMTSTGSSQPGGGAVPGAGIRQAVRDAALDLGRLRAALPQLVRGVAALHRERKLHRDLKPSNVLVARDGRVVVCDFGLVAEAAAASAEASAAPDARAGRLTGTPAFMSPEQVRGGEVGPASDWYALGVMLYLALTGRAPYEGSLDEVLAAKQAHDARPPRALVASAPADLDALCVQLLAREPAARPDGAAILARLEAQPRAADEERAGARLPFVGRAAETDALAAALADSRDGQTRAVFVHGPSGMGKSALIEHFLDGVQAGGAVVLRGRCYERESVPYKALDSLIDALAAHLFERPGDQVAALLSGDIAALARLFPVLRRVPAIAAAVPPVAISLEPLQLRRQAFAALREILVALARVGAVVLYIDDLQWGDVDSAAFLIDLLDRPAPGIGLFVGSYRSADAATSPLLRVLGVDREAAAVGATEVRTIELAPLPAAEARALAGRILGAAGGDGGGDARVGAVVDEAGGHPLFIAELARAAAAAPSGGGRALGLDDVLAERIARLPPEAHALLVASSVAGRPLPVGLVGRASEITDEAAALAALQAELLVRTRPGVDAPMIEPYHDRIRETVVGRLPERDARRVHRRLARALESSRHADPLALVQLWLGAGDAERACTYAAQAAALSEETLAFDRAAHYYQLLLELAPLDGDARRALAIKLGDVRVAAGRLEDAAAAYLAAAEGADRALSLELRRRAFEQLLRSGNFDAGLPLVDDVLAELGLRLPRSHAGTLAFLLTRRARLALRGVRYQARPEGERDPELVRKADVCWSVSSGMSFIDPTVAAAFQSQFLIFALRAGEPRRVTIAFGLEMAFRAMTGTRARRSFEWMHAIAAQAAADSGDPAVAGVVEACIGLCHLLVGEFRTGYEKIAAGEAAMHGDAIGLRWQIDVAHNYEATGLYYLGRLRALAEQVPALLRDAAERGDEYLMSCMRSWRSNAAWLVVDDVEQARRQLDEDVRRHPRPGRFRLHNYFRLNTEAQIALYAGDAAAAWPRVSQAWPAFKGSMLPRIQTVFVEAHCLRARCALAAARAGAGDRDALLADVGRSATALERQRVPWASALAALARAGAARLRGDDDAAARGFAEAAAGCAAVDLAAYAAAARFRHGELVGGDQGAAEQAAAIAWLHAERVAVPARWIDLLAPA